MRLLTALAFLYMNVPSLANADFGGRPHANIRPNPTIPMVTMPADTSPTRDGAVLPPYSTIYYFDQLIDHNRPELGTFQQRYMFTWEYYQKGGPIILSTPGETNAARFFTYLTNITVPGLIAQPNHGATVVLEHRFFGLSNPYPDLSSASFAVHTTDQAIEDFVYFAKNVHLPFPAEIEDGSQVGPDRNPWILVGGSYAGALVSWTMVSHPGVFHAGYSSSGVVQAIDYYYGYFEPIRRNMPRNCSSDVELVIDYMDRTFKDGTKEEKDALKAKFGMSNVTHYDDVASTLRNQFWTWQSLTPLSGGAVFYNFCDALEMKDGVAAGPEGWGLVHALDAWGKYETQYVATFCQDTPQDECLGTYDSTLAYWHDTKVDQSYRSWQWICCNEVGFWRDGAPEGSPSLVSRLITPQYDYRQCTYWFPEAFPTATAPKTYITNAKYMGWDVNVDRLFFVNAKKDPWIEASVSSEYNPRTSTERQPIYVLDNGYHCSDLVTRYNVAPDIKAVQDTAVATFTRWISEFVPGQRANALQALDVVIPQAKSKDDTNSTTSSLELEPPAVDLGVVNSGVPEPRTGGAPTHVGRKGAWDVDLVIVNQS